MQKLESEILEINSQLQEMLLTFEPDTPYEKLNEKAQSLMPDNFTTWFCRYHHTPLHCAVKKGQTRLVQYLIWKGINVNIKDTSEKTPLHYVETVEMAQILLQAGANISLTDSSGFTALHHVVYDNHSIELAKFLISQGLDVNARTKDERTPLHHVRTVEMAQILLQAGVNISLTDSSGFTALHHVVYDNHSIELTKFLISQGLDVNARTKDERTPLHYVETVEMAQILLQAGANIFLTDRYGFSALHYVVENNKSIDLAKFLISQGLDINARTKEERTPLHLARTIEHVQVLLRNDADINAVCSKGNTVLHEAVAHDSNIDIVRCFIDNGIDVNAKNTTGLSPLHMLGGKTLYSGKWSANMVKIAKVLVDNGAIVEVGDNCGRTPLFNVITKAPIDNVEENDGRRPYNYCTECITLLLDCGADINVRDTTGSTPLNNLIQYTHELDHDYGFTGFYKYLMRKGANINIPDNYGRTPLHNAMRDHVDIKGAELLLDSGAEINAVDHEGFTALHRLAMEDPCKGDTRLRQVGIEKLLTNRADSSIKNKRGETPLHLAAAAGNYVAVYSLLVSHYKNVHAINLFGETPLHLAVRHERSVIIKVLLRYGAKVNKVYNVTSVYQNQHIEIPMFSALKVAAMTGNESIYKLLEKHGRDIAERSEDEYLEHLQIMQATQQACLDKRAIKIQQLLQENAKSRGREMDSCEIPELIKVSLFSSNEDEGEPICKKGKFHTEDGVVVKSTSHAVMRSG